MFTGLSSNSTDTITQYGLILQASLIWVILTVWSPLQGLQSAENYDIWEERDQKAEAHSSNVIRLKFYRKQIEIHK